MNWDQEIAKVKIGHPKHVNKHLDSYQVEDANWDNERLGHALLDHGNEEFKEKLSDQLPAFKPKTIQGQATKHNLGLHLAEVGSDKIRHFLLDKKCLNAVGRSYIAWHGNDSNRDKLINDKSYQVRKFIARHGSDAHREKLLQDPDRRVRLNVAQNANKEHAEKLTQDSVKQVSNAAKLRLKRLAGVKPNNQVTASVKPVPPEMGQSPIPEGRMRRFHVTRPSNIPSIEKHGLRLSDAKGYEGPLGIYSHDKASHAKRYSNGFGSIVEFHDDPDHYKYSPTYSKIDVPSENIVAIHHPWHEQYRYIKENKIPLSKVEPHRDDPHYKDSYDQLKAEGYG
jgi:hypothetical protein